MRHSFDFAQDVNISNLPHITFLPTYRQNLCLNKDFSSRMNNVDGATVQRDESGFRDFFLFSSLRLCPSLRSRCHELSLRDLFTKQTNILSSSLLSCLTSLFTKQSIMYFLLLCCLAFPTSLITHKYLPRDS